MAPRWPGISAERVAAELDKLLVGEDPAAGIDLMVQSGMGAWSCTNQWMRMAIDEHRNWAIYQRSLDRAAAGDRAGDGGPNLVLRWAALLHDISGKPATPAPSEPDGGVSFHHHEVVGAKMVRKRMRALKYSNRPSTTSHPAGAAVSRLRRWEMDRLCGAPLCHRRRGPYCHGCASQCAPTARPATAPGRAVTGQLRPAGSGSRSWPPRRIWIRCADLDGNQIVAVLDIPAGPQVGRRGAAKELRLERGVVHRGGDNRRLLSWSGNHGGRWQVASSCCELLQPATSSAGIWNPFDVDASTVTASWTRLAWISTATVCAMTGRQTTTLPTTPFDVDNMTAPQAVSTTDPGTWAVAVDQGGQLRWYGLDGVEHRWSHWLTSTGSVVLDDRLLDTIGDLGLADQVL